MPDLSIIIVSWNVREMLAACLRSIEQYHGTLALEIIVVDSASSDDSAAMVARDFPSVVLMAESENIGFVRGNNLALARAAGRHLLLLNPDTLVHPYALDKMVAYLDAHPQVGIVGPHTLNSDGTHQSTRRRFPSLLIGMIESTWLQGFAPRRWLDAYYVGEMPNDAVLAVDWVQGSALMARREVYAQIGGLDTAFVMFFEELDWCQRAKAAGWQVAYLGDAVITHHGGGSASQVTARKHVHFQQSKLHYFHKHHGVAAAALLRGVLVANYSAQVLVEGGKLLLRHKPALRRERIRAYAVVLRGLLSARPQQP